MIAITNLGPILIEAPNPEFQLTAVLGVAGQETEV
jgi:hypothetical protein